MFKKAVEAGIGLRMHLVLMVSLIFAIDLLVFFDVPVLRQVFGFVFLFIVPGYLILWILRLERLDSVERLVLSAGLSLSFLILFGLFINCVLLEFGYFEPLSTLSILMSLNIAFILLFLLANRGGAVFSLPTMEFGRSEKLLLVPAILFPAVSVLGTHLMNLTGDNTVLLFLLTLIPVYVLVICFRGRGLNPAVYPLVILSISLSLILQLSLRSEHIIGSDVHSEFYFFQMTLKNLYWSVTGNSTLDACLSISILPVIYSSVLGINPELLFKVLYSLLYSVSPLVIYVISRRYVKDLYAFITSFFFMSQSIFLWTEYNPRTSIAVFFFALAMLVLFSKEINPMKKRLLFTLFVVSCLVSHYATTYLFFVILLILFLVMAFVPARYRLDKPVSPTAILLFFTLMFLWYSQVVETPFSAGMSFIKNTFISLNDFFVGEMRSEVAQHLLGGAVDEGAARIIKFVSTWLTFILIGVGVVYTAIKHREMSFFGLSDGKADFLREKFDSGYFVTAVICSALAVITISIPFISIGYSIERAYAVLLVVLSVFFSVGGIVIAKHVRLNPTLLILLILAPYYLSVTGVTYSFMGIPYSIILSSEGFQYDVMYVHEQETWAAQWLKHNAGELKLYSDHYGDSRLTSQGFISSPKYASSFIYDKKPPGGYMYLRYTAAVKGLLMDKGYQLHNLSEYDFILEGENRIYDNGGSLVYL